MLATHLRSSRLRHWSRVLGVSSIVVPAVLLAFQLSTLGADAAAQPGYVCGLPVLGLWLLAIGASGVISLVASVLNATHLLRTRPASIARWAELGFIAVPALVGAAAILSF